MLLQGCGNGASSSTTTSTGSTPTTPTVTANPGASSVAMGQTFSVAVSLSGSGATPTGTVAVISGNYASFEKVLSGGKVTLQVPAALLAAGSDTLTAYYTPDLASSNTYNSASGTAMVTVTAGPAAPSVTTSYVTYPTAGAPFQAVVDSAGTVFVGIPSGVQVFAPGSGGLASVCTNTLSSTLLSEGASATNLSLIPNGVNLAVGIGSPGAAFFNLAALNNCTATGFVVSQGSIASDQGTMAVDVTPDGKYAFVSNEYGVALGATSEGNIGVVQLVYDANGNVTTGTTLLGQISTGGNAIAGMTLSPDGTRLYVSSEVATSASDASGSSNPILSESNCVQAAGSSPQLNGTLTVINVAAAESLPGPAAILATVDAGCSPVRMAESADESTLWVAARGDNRVLAFSTGMLEFNPGNALLGYASTGGTAPVGIRLFDNDQLLAVANSNRFNTGTANSTILSVADPASASLLQTTQTGLFPREIWLGPDDATLYLTNYDSDTLEVISTTVQ
jgi:DNA-binding beta-propeller fold protein YncE